MIVVGTNILAHFWLNGEHRLVCEQLFKQDSEWVAPVLWKSEFRNVVVLYLRKGFIEFSTAIQILNKVEQQMAERSYHVNTLRVLELVSCSNCSAYDCEFVSLAADLEIKLATFDKEILKSFREIAFNPLTL